MVSENYKYEIKSMIQFILAGHRLKETAEEHGVSAYEVKKRLQSVGYSYADLVEMRNQKKFKKSQGS